MPDLIKIYECPSNFGGCLIIGIHNHVLDKIYKIETFNLILLGLNLKNAITMSDEKKHELKHSIDFISTIYSYYCINLKDTDVKNIEMEALFIKNILSSIYQSQIVSFPVEEKVKKLI